MKCSVICLPLLISKQDVVDDFSSKDGCFIVGILASCQMVSELFCDNLQHNFIFRICISISFKEGSQKLFLRGPPIYLFFMDLHCNKHSR